MKFGMGLWNSVAVTIVVEGMLFVAGIVIYLKATRPRDSIGIRALWALIVLLALIFISGVLAPPPPSEHAVAWVTLGLWLFVPWGYWIDRHRAMVAA